MLITSILSKLEKKISHEQRSEVFLLIMLITIMEIFKLIMLITMMEIFMMSLLSREQNSLRRNNLRVFSSKVGIVPCDSVTDDHF